MPVIIQTEISLQPSSWPETAASSLNWGEKDDLVSINETSVLGSHFSST